MGTRELFKNCVIIDCNGLMALQLSQAVMLHRMPAAMVTITCMSSRALPTNVFGNTHVRARCLILTSHVCREEFLPSTRLLSSWARVVEREVKDCPGRHPGQARRGSRRSSELGKTEPTFCMNVKCVESPNEHALLGGSIAICICGEP